MITRKKASKPAIRKKDSRLPEGLQDKYRVLGPGVIYVTPTGHRVDLRKLSEAQAKRLILEGVKFLKEL